MKNADWYVYIVQCRDGRLYTGVSNDVSRRVSMHNRGKGCRFTKFRYPVTLLYEEYCGSQSSAQRREAEIKKLNRAEKLALVSNDVL